ncbi:EAL domain-containing protein [Tardiphaga sp.]|uniref:EAL domain-containing protein n=1 Tax=Tardiphaga sp. TaxID=1926292 RepID=UPI0037DA6338
MLAHNLGLSVTAEGVETEAQEAFLRAKNCDEVQGFRYSRPLPQREVEYLLARSRTGELRSV